MSKIGAAPELQKKQTLRKKLSWLSAGIFFAALWASASTATKIGLSVAQPLVLAVVRFGMASAIMLLAAHGFFKQRLPTSKEWKPLTIYGFLNITIYLGCYVVAMQTVTAGIGALAIASNPVFIGFLSVFFLKKTLHFSTVLGLVICTGGVLCATWPLLKNASVSVPGLLLLLFSMLSYSVGAIYFSSKQWNGLSLLVINGWQTLFGGLLLLPFTFFFYKSSGNRFNATFWASAGWLAIAVSILAVQLWLWLLQVNTVRAGLWLFLCPLFGFAFAAWLMNDVISRYTIAGILLVIGGLIVSKIDSKRTEAMFD